MPNSIMGAGTGGRTIARGRARARLGLAVVAAALIASAGRVEAEPARILVTYFEGRAAAIRSSALQIMRQCCRLASGREYERVARRRKLWTYTPAQITELAGALDADGVLTGTMQRRGGGFRVTLRLHDGKTGQPVATVQMRVRRPRLRPVERQRLQRELVAAVRKLETGSRAGDASDGVASADDGNALEDIDELGLDDGAGDAAGDGGATGAGDPAATGDADLGATPGATSGTTIDATANARARSPVGTAAATGRSAPMTHAQQRTGVELRLGGSATGRQLRSTVAGPDIHGPGYSGPPAPGVRVDAEIYPAVLLAPESGALGNLGVRVGFERIFGLSSTLEVSDTMSVELDTVHVHLDAALMWRLFLGSGQERPMLVLMAGYDRLLFAVDETDAPDGVVVDMPDVDYSSASGGLSLRLPLSAKVATTLAARFLYVLDAGEMSEEDSFGDSTSFGVDAGVDVELRLAERVWLRLGGGVQYFHHDLDGTGAQSNLRDGDAATVDVTELDDFYFGGRATTGFVF
jgi:hypothetical protein